MGVGGRRGWDSQSHSWGLLSPDMRLLDPVFESGVKDDLDLCEYSVLCHNCLVELVASKVILFQETKRDCISKKTITEFLERLALYEKWVLKSLLGSNQTVKVAAANVKVIVRKNNVEPETHFGDLYVVQNIKNGTVSFKLYSPKDNKFIWTIDTVSNLDGYVDLKCNTHILHLGDSFYTFKFPDKKERTLFRDNLNKFLFFEKSKK